MLRIKLVKSPIGNTKTNRRTVAALGLRKMHHTVYLPDNAAVRGMVHHVKHMLEVAVVDDSEAPKKTATVKKKTAPKPAVAPRPAVAPKAVTAKPSDVSDKSDKSDTDGETKAPKPETPKAAKPKAVAAPKPKAASASKTTKKAKE
ncbi:MAG: 50S ribosomal protein L30 [Armatimonadetes bacterium]|nr:50S ribosomal protein L30 [Armatimonadota bacterium]